MEVDSVSDDPAFILSFTSLSIILLAFFVFLNSLAVPDDLRQQAVLASVNKNFTKAMNPAAYTFTESKNPADIPIPELATGFPQLTFQTRYGRLADIAESEELNVKRENDRFVITLPGARLFESGSDEIRADYLSTLSKLASSVIELPLNIEIEGHTDNRPISTQRFPSNWELSAARAVSVLRFFIDQGITTSRLSASGLAEHHPIASNDTEVGRAQNRRIVLIITEAEQSETNLR